MTKSSRSSGSIFAGNVLLVIVVFGAALGGYFVWSSWMDRTPTLSGSVYENQFLKVSIPTGWKASAAKGGAVNITKGNYILYINPATSQVSGAVGGRLGEISTGAPSADTVIIDQQNALCGVTENHAAYTDYTRVDFYVNSKNKQVWCAAPANGSTVWYFSYITGKDGGYFNYYSEGYPTPIGFVITMAYNSKDINKLPVKGSAELNTMLAKMTDIAKTFVLKQVDTITYTSDLWGFEIKYPFGFKLTNKTKENTPETSGFLFGLGYLCGDPQKSRLCLEISKEDVPRKTDLTGATVYVSLVEGVSSTQCSRVDGDATKAAPTFKTIGGLKFNYWEHSGAALGSQEAQRIYRIHENDSCYQITQMLNFTTIENIDNHAEKGYRRLSKSEVDVVWGNLDQILLSFKFQK